MWGGGEKILNADLGKVLINMIKAILKIQPLAPLSLVTTTPGSFYRSDNSPSDEMIYGMLENMMGWHYSKEIRRSYLKAIKKSFKKDRKEVSETNSLSGFAPLIQNFVQIKELLLFPHTTPFTDLWTQHMKGSDNRHVKGSRNYDHRLNRKINLAKDDAEKNVLLKGNFGKFPNYYQSPTKREFVLVEGEYGYEIEIDDGFLNEFQASIENPQALPYLGTSEGWVNVKLEILKEE